MLAANHRRNVNTGLLVTLLISVTCLFAGCSNTNDESASTNRPNDDAPDRSNPILSGADQFADGGNAEVGSETFESPVTPLPSDADRQTVISGKPENIPSGANAPAPPDEPDGFPLVVNPESSMVGGAESVTAPAAMPAQRKLNENLTPTDLVRLLESSDSDMQLLAQSKGGPEDPQERSELMRELAALKLQGAIALQKHPDATEEQQATGVRGQLQALSHLASRGDAASSKALKVLATDLLTSDDATLAADSRIVLIGFAIDQLISGKSSAAPTIVELVNGIQPNPTSDLPSVFMMARAREVLANYGMLDEAGQVRDRILELYRDSPNQMIAKAAADAAGAAKYEVAERLLMRILTDDRVALSRWTTTVDELIFEAPDMNTVQFLAMSALQLESEGRDEFVDATFAALKQAFDDPSSAMAVEIQKAIDAMKARENILGSSISYFDTFPTASGDPISPIEYQGKVVLMPFWAILIPGSLQTLPMLRDIQQKYPEQVRIVGLNLDPADAPLRRFLQKSAMEFPSFRSISAPEEEIANPVVSRFGAVSFPFVAVFNQAGKLEALDLTGRRIEGLVDQMVKQGNEE